MQRERCTRIRVLLPLHIDCEVVLWQGGRRGCEEQLCSYLRVD